MYTFVKGEPNWVEPLNENFAEVAALAGAAVPASEKGAAGGVATLGSDGKLAQMPTANDIGVFTGFRPTSWTRTNHQSFLSRLSPRILGQMAAFICLQDKKQRTAKWLKIGTFSRTSPFYRQ